jgi:hypothetical protein
MESISKIKVGDRFFADSQEETPTSPKKEKEEYIVEKIYRHMIVAFTMKNGYKFHRGFSIGDLVIYGLLDGGGSFFDDVNIKK